MRAIVYYISQPTLFELHGLERLLYDDLTMAEAKALMQIPAVRSPDAPPATVEFRGRVFNRHEDNRVLIRNAWGITDVHVVNRRQYTTMLLPADDLAVLERD